MIYGRGNNLPGPNAVFPVLRCFVITYECVELGLNIAVGQGAPARKVHDLRAYMLYVPADHHLIAETNDTIRSPMQVYSK